jgi:hypothetical protein
MRVSQSWCKQAVIRADFGSLDPAFLYEIGTETIAYDILCEVKQSQERARRSPGGQRS